MSNILHVYKPVPYTHAALQLLTGGWQLPSGLDIPCLAEGEVDNLPARLEQTGDALKRVETLIGEAGTDAERLLLHNIARLPVIELRQRLTREAFENMPRTIVPYSDAKQIMEEILYEAIKQKTGEKHTFVNNIDGYEDEVQYVIDCLLDAEGQGHDTHGVSRLPDYVQSVLDGKIDTLGRVELTEEASGKLSFDGGGTFGQVAAQIALQVGLEHLNTLNGTAVVVTMRHAYHAGRLERIAREATRKGFICLVLLNVGGKGRTAPEGGMEPRWGTNPIAFGVPTGIGEDGIIGDTATTARPEGWVQVAFQNGLIVPLDILRTPEGHQTIDPAGVYRKDGKPDLLLPMGGEIASYKGAVLGEMIELIVDAVSGRMPGESTQQKNNNIVLILIKGNEDTFAAIRERVAYIESCPTVSGEPIRRPGAEGLRKLEIAKREGLSIATGTWDKVLALREQLCGKA